MNEEKATRMELAIEQLDFVSELSNLHTIKMCVNEMIIDFVSNPKKGVDEDDKQGLILFAHVINLL